MAPHFSIIYCMFRRICTTTENGQEQFLIFYMMHFFTFECLCDWRLHLANNNLLNYLLKSLLKKIHTEPYYLHINIKLIPFLIFCFMYQLFTLRCLCDCISMTKKQWYHVESPHFSMIYCMFRRICTATENW
jgi:hypothetical protein